MMRLRNMSASLAILLSRHVNVSLVSSFVVTSTLSPSPMSHAATVRSSTFTSPSATSTSSTHLRMADTSEASTSTLPTVEQAAKDGFMQQLSHASEICSLLEQSSPDSESLASELLKAQLSHSDGVRGFFATYLTGEGSIVADKENIPVPLAKAMDDADMDVLVPLACVS